MSLCLVLDTVSKVDKKRFLTVGKNVYKFTVEHLKNSKGNTMEVEPLVFETQNHEDVFKIVQIMDTKMDLDKNESTSLAIGLKLFSGVMLKHNDSEPFKQLMPHFKEFMKELKKS